MSNINTYYLRCDFRHGTGDRFAGTSVIRHFKLHRVADLQMFNVAAKLTEMEKQSSLSLTALDKSVRVLRKIRLKMLVLLAGDM